GSAMGFFGDCARCVRTFAPLPSAGAPSLRTDVPINEELEARAAHARRPAPDPLVPLARGRLRRRLGGRPGRAGWADPSAPGAAARADEPQACGIAPGRSAGAARACLPLPRRAPGTRNGARCED